MENVKKCKNFLSTLIKLASSGKQSTETAANVKELVQNLLVRCWRLPNCWGSTRLGGPNMCQPSVLLPLDYPRRSVEGVHW